MQLWEIANPVANFSGNASQTLYRGKQNVSSAYAQILAEKISNIKADVEQMEAVQEQLDEIDELHAELTGGGVNIPTVETVARFMPDGSIMVTTYEDGKITEQVKHKPHMTVMPDYTAPPKPDGSVDTELKPTQNFDLQLLLMM
ncbi:MAG: DUF3813 domain-containing protein [Selenomonadaceae bacterium]|nr:DUF3813 domain-containing protein [Selenomonadaceae bacterium]